MNNRAADLTKQANLLATVALGKPVTSEDQALLLNAAEATARAATRAKAPILQLTENATPTEVKQARRFRAIRKGKEVYLPSWRDLCTALPNGLLRSALWSVTAIGYGTQEESERKELVKDEAFQELPSEPVDARQGTEASLPTYGDFSLINRGPKLGWYDRRVFAACLDHYKGDRPLYRGDGTMTGDAEPSWIPISYFQFLQSMGVAYHPDSHKSLRKSLERLSALSLHVRAKGLEVQIPRLIEVSFSDGKGRGNSIHASDSILFRVLEPIAELYGPASWTAVPHSALTAGKGLKSWIASFYATHKGPYAMKVDDLYSLTGAVSVPGKFKSQLKETLDALKKSDIPKEIRVSGYEMNKAFVTVHLARWS